jgi:hypothetical protein
MSAFDGGGECQMLAPHVPFSLTEHKRWFALAGSTDKHTFAVQADSSLELTLLAQFWSNFGSCDAELQIDFRGVVPSTCDVHLDGATSIAADSVQL